MENSNLYHKGFEEKYATKCDSDWYKFTDEELEYYKDEKKCEEKQIKCPKRSLVLCDSRTVHCGGKSIYRKSKRKYCIKNDLKKKIKVFEEMMNNKSLCK